MSSFLIKNKTEKIFEEKISKRSRKTYESTKAANRSSNRFCKEYYNGKTTEEIFEELNILKGKEHTHALREVMQSWIDSQYQNGSLTSSVQQHISKIKKIISHNGIRFHASNFDEPLKIMPRIKEELYELTVEEIQNILKYASPKKIGYYLALSCSGTRPGELLQVRKNDIDTTQKRINIRIEAENVKTRLERYIWLTKEADVYLMSKIKKLENNNMVWCTNQNF